MGESDLWRAAQKNAARKRDDLPPVDSCQSQMYDGEVGGRGG